MYWDSDLRYCKYLCEYRDFCHWILGFLILYKVIVSSPFMSKKLLVKVSFG